MKPKHDFNFFRSMYNKNMIRFGFCDIHNNQGLGKGYQPSSLSGSPEGVEKTILMFVEKKYHKKVA